MTPERIPTGFLPLPQRTILSLGGPDRLRFLNGQVTNDIRLVHGDTCLPAAVLDSKGRLDAFCHVRDIGDCFLLDAHPDLRQSLLARLDRYLIADQVELADVSDAWHLVHVLGAEIPEVAGTRRFPVPRFGVPGIDLLSPAPLSLDLPELDPAEVEALRIRRGVPLWPAELHAGVFPAEAGLDTTAVSFDKGCYLGQEVVSRMKRAGKTNRHLVLLAVPPGTTAGTELLHDGQGAGTITSVSPATESNGTRHAIAYRHRQHASADEFALPTGTARVLHPLP